MTPTLVLAAVPSPARGVWHLGPFPVRAYALCIIVGVAVAVVVTQRRLIARGGPSGVVADIATWGVPFGLVGARLYHLATNPELYWGAHGAGTLAALKIWDGGLGIWGAVAAGALGCWLAARRYGVEIGPLADSVAPALPLAQACGRWGNWFNQELYGRATHLPWALHITHPADGGVPGYYHPTFLYESLWDVGVALLVVALDRRHRFSRGRAFAVYVVAYTIGRFWIEALRIDDAHRYLGLRLNDYVAVVVFLAGCGYLLLVRPRHEEPVPEDGHTGVSLM